MGSVPAPFAGKPPQLKDKVHVDVADAILQLYSKVQRLQTDFEALKNSIGALPTRDDLQAHAVRVAQAVSTLPVYDSQLTSGGSVVLSPSALQTIQGLFPGAVLVVQAPAGATLPALSVVDATGAVIASFGLAVVLATPVQIGGGVSSYNGTPTVGFGLPAIQVLQPSTPTTPVGATNIYAAAPAGLYRIDVYFVVTTAGVGGTGITLNLSYTDAQGARTDSTLTVSGLATGQVMKASFFIQQQAAGPISYTITETGAFAPHPTLAGFVVAERLN
jgi:hypothetical protein